MDKVAYFGTLANAQAAAIEINKALSCPIRDGSGYYMQEWVDPNSIDSALDGGYYISYPPSMRGKTQNQILSKALNRTEKLLKDVKIDKVETIGGWEDVQAKK